MTTPKVLCLLQLLALGGFETPGFPFLGRGAGTRYVLAHMTLPVLFSH